MIVTLTLNPSLDRTVEIGELARGAVIRAGSARLDPGGKGVNVTRALLANGAPSRAVLPCGGDEGEQLARLLHAEGVDVIAVPIAAHTRSNISLAERDGTITKVNEPGPRLSSDELDAVAAAVEKTAGRAGWVAACGSLPPGVPVEFYADLCRRCSGQGIQVAVDTSGPALLAAIDARPALIKPNRDELAAAVGSPIATIQDVVDAAQILRSWGARAVLASLGADGVVLVCDEGVTVGEADVPRPRSSVGAGDALLAGFLAGGAHGQAAVAQALAWASAAVSLPGSRMPAPADIRRAGVRIHAGPDLTRQLVTPL
jgi:1-phosphofructokinase